MGNKATVWTMIVCTVIILAGMLILAGQIPDAPVIPEINVPTAEAIGAAVAGQIVIPVPAVPESADNQKLQELWDSTYGLEIESLETEAFDLCLEELEDDNELDSIYDLADEDFVFDEDSSIAELFEEDAEVVFVKEYDDDREITVTNLGLDEDNDDDRAVTLSSVIKVEVEPDMGDDFKDKVYMTCEVTEDDGDLEAEVTYSLEA